MSKGWTSERAAEEFIRYFTERGHTLVKSSPLLPTDDPTLLFVNAGMNQFKPYFLGGEDAPWPRAVSVQKCLRAGGKHNDLDDVGKTRRHHTFFEMLGNFSFGDYFKPEAVRFAWELVTEVFGVNPERLSVTVYDEDDEAYDIWKSETGLPTGRIFRLDAKENFWEMGEKGPAGPCSELHYDLGVDADPQQKSPETDGERFLELWNLVFMEVERRPDGTLSDLPRKNIDTGMGLERLLVVLQGVLSNYETDLFVPISAEIERLTGVPRRQSVPAHDAISDHARALTLSICDNIYPGNFGRGYVVRRILRRGLRLALKLGCEKPLLYRLVPVVARTLSSRYPELAEKQEEIAGVIKLEEELFLSTLARQLPRLEEAIERAKGAGVLKGADAFQLYDTYGIPLDLIREAAQQGGVELDTGGFEEGLDQQRRRARVSAKGARALPQPAFGELTESRFTGYDTQEAQSLCVAWGEHEKGSYLVLEETPFYAESGGQTGDTGLIEGEGFAFRVNDTQRHNGTIFHIGEPDGELPKESVTVRARVDAERRWELMRAHTATHLLHAALRERFGESVHQEGSLVEPGRLRFDFTLPKAVSRDELAGLSERVYGHVLANHAVRTDMLGYDEALKQGAVALFGEKYGERVRVVTVEEVSQELCGGTHVERTGQVGAFRLTRERSVAAGVRRVEAVVGMRALRSWQDDRKVLEEVDSRLKLLPGNDEDPEEYARSRLLEVLSDAEEQKRAYTDLLKQFATLLGDSLASGRGVVFTARLKEIGPRQLRAVADTVVERLPQGYVLALGSQTAERAYVHVRVDRLFSSRVSARDLILAATSLLGGSGGGSSVKAEGGGKETEMLEKALQEVGRLAEEA